MLLGNLVSYTVGLIICAHAIRVGYRLYRNPEEYVGPISVIFAFIGGVILTLLVVGAGFASAIQAVDWLNNFTVW